MKFIFLAVLTTIVLSINIDTRADLDAKMKEVRESGSAGALVVDLA